MRELDNNLKARLADYINGKPVKVTDEELELMAGNDTLAEEVIEIAAISQEAEKAMQGNTDGGKGRTIKMLWMSIAACLIFGLSLGVLLQQMSSENTAPHSLNSTLRAAAAPDMGFSNLPDEFEELIQSASERAEFDYKPNEAFDLTLSGTFHNDTLVLCNAKGLTLLRARVNENIVPIEGLSEGLYYYYLIYHPKEKGALAIGWAE